MIVPLIGERTLTPFFVCTDSLPSMESSSSLALWSSACPIFSPLAASSYFVFEAIPCW